ncbi:MAG: ATP-binding protein [Gammaproteobacteria bacterium SHHR-1]
MSMTITTQHAIDFMTAIIKHNPKQAVHLSGPPGVGKTSIIYQAAIAAGIPEDRILLLRPSLMDPVDLLGTPRILDDGSTAFAPPANLLAFRKGTGPGVIIIDELPQSAVAMQNALGGLLLDQILGALEFDPQVARISTGNRVQDKAGAMRILSQIGGRIVHLEIAASLDVWCRWAIGAGVDPLVIAFLRLRPNLLHDFDPDRVSNPTPRTWEMVARLPTQLPEHIYAAGCAGLVGEAAATEWVGTRKFLNQMPSIDGILAHPQDSHVPEEPVIKYAVASALAQRVTHKTFDAAMQYMVRLPAEFQVLFCSLADSRDSTLLDGPTFSAWAINKAHLMF